MTPVLPLRALLALLLTLPAACSTAATPSVAAATDPVAENMLQAQPTLKGIFSVNDNGSLGALSAIEASGLDVKLVSVDGAPEAIKAIQKPGSKFIATSAQYPRDQIRLALGIALAKKWGAQVPATLPVDITLIDQAKAKDFSW